MKQKDDLMNKYKMYHFKVRVTIIKELKNLTNMFYNSLRNFA